MGHDGKQAYDELRDADGAAVALRLAGGKENIEKPKMNSVCRCIQFFGTFVVDLCSANLRTFLLQKKCLSFAFSLAGINASR